MFYHWASLYVVGPGNRFDQIKLSLLLPYPLQKNNLDPSLEPPGGLVMCKKGKSQTKVTTGLILCLILWNAGLPPFSQSLRLPFCPGQLGSPCASSGSSKSPFRTPTWATPPAEVLSSQNSQDVERRPCGVSGAKKRERSWEFLGEVI